MLVPLNNRRAENLDSCALFCGSRMLGLGTHEIGALGSLHVIDHVAQLADLASEDFDRALFLRGIRTRISQQGHGVHNRRHNVPQVVS